MRTRLPLVRSEPARVVKIRLDRLVSRAGSPSVERSGLCARLDQGFTSAETGRPGSIRHPLLVPGDDLAAQPQLRASSTSLVDRLGHVYVAPLILVDSIRMREPEQVGDFMRVDEIVDIHLSPHGSTIRDPADRSAAPRLTFSIAMLTVVSIAMDGDSFERELAIVGAYWDRRRATTEMTAGSVARYTRVLASFARFVEASGFNTLSDASTSVCKAFIRGSRTDGRPPAPATSRFRLTVVRDAYLALALSGRATNDPTAELRVPQLSQVRESAPLTPVEAARLRSSGRIAPKDHLRPTTVELALLGGSHMEIAEVVVGDLDLRGARITMGSRSLELDAFAVATLSARVGAARNSARRTRRPWDPSTEPLALTRPLSMYPATSIAPSISSNLSRALASAGITRTGVRPASVREYAANRQYAIAGIEAAAALLGLDSLDTTRGFICTDWQRQFAREVRLRDSS